MLTKQHQEVLRGPKTIDLVPLSFDFMNKIRHLFVLFDDCSLSTKHVIWATFYGAMPILFLCFYFAFFFSKKTFKNFGTQFMESF